MAVALKQISTFALLMMLTCWIIQGLGVNCTPIAKPLPDPGLTDAFTDFKKDEILTEQHKRRISEIEDAKINGNKIVTPTPNVMGNGDLDNGNKSDNIRITIWDVLGLCLLSVIGIVCLFFCTKLFQFLIKWYKTIQQENKK